MTRMNRFKLSSGVNLAMNKYFDFVSYSFQSILLNHVKRLKTKNLCLQFLFSCYFCSNFTLFYS